MGNNILDPPVAPDGSAPPPIPPISILYIMKLRRLSLPPPINIKGMRLPPNRPELLPARAEASLAIIRFFLAWFWFGFAVIKSYISEGALWRAYISVEVLWDWTWEDRRDIAVIPEYKRLQWRVLKHFKHLSKWLNYVQLFALTDIKLFVYKHDKSKECNKNVR